MKNLLNSTASTAAGILVFCVGCALAGLGLGVLALLALFGLAAACLGILVAPLAAIAHAQDEPARDVA